MFFHDSLHHEALRIQGRLNTHFKYDRNSRLQHKQIQRNQNPILPDILIKRSYQYDSLDRLVSKKHSKHGQTDYRYDQTGRIEGCRNQRYRENLQYDVAANLLDSKYSNHNLISFNLLLKFRGQTYSYNTEPRRSEVRIDARQTRTAMNHWRG